MQGSRWFVGKGTCCEDWEPKFNPWAPRGGEKEGAQPRGCSPGLTEELESSVAHHAPSGYPCPWPSSHRLIQ